MITSDWYGCYSDGWQGEICEDAFAHPAKFSRGLIRRIYAHCLERGYLKPGDVVLDVFGGVGLGARDAMAAGLDWLGVELEEKFVGLGEQNIARWMATGEKAAAWGMSAWGNAALVQGDSRELGRVLSQAGGVVSSPPYADGAQHTGGETHMTSGQGGLIRFVDYGSNPANLGNLPEGSHAAVVSSPPFSQPGEQPCASQSQAIKDYHAFTRGSGSKLDHQMETPGNLGAMCVVSSPPYAESLSSDDPDKRGGLFRDERRRNDKTLTAEYGQSAGQLGRMRVVSSPPYEGSVNQSDGANDAGARLQRKAQAGVDISYAPNVGGPNSVLNKPQVYGQSDGQLGADTGSDFWTAAATIMREVYAVLPAGGVAVWVVKGFVRDKKYVNFPAQWMQLGESCGFVTLEWIRAWLVEERGAQHTLDGGIERKTIQRKSFFRRLAERNGSPRIDYEVVLIQQKVIE